MNIQIFGSNKSFDTKKARRWFQERRISFQYVDLPSRGLSPREYQSIRRKLAVEDLMDAGSKAWQVHYMEYLTAQAREEKLMEYPELFRTPIVRNGQEATVGYCPDIWAKWT